MRNKFFPTLIIDDFLPNVDQIVEHANSVEFSYDNESNWPGKRSELLHLIDNDLFVYIGNKILSAHNLKTNSEWIARAAYQLVDGKYSQGWVHSDEVVLTSIIYLNKKNNLNSGTSLYWPKRIYNKAIHRDVKHNFFKKMKENPNYEMSDFERRCLQENNDLFYEVLNVKNVFNRLFSFEGNMFHSANDFDNEETRLTLIYFFTEINLKENRYPLSGVV